jgi:hypothetical protein
MVKRFYSVLCCLLLCSVVFGQNKDFRGPGYKGSVSVTDQYGVFVGLETSHGVMLNRNHYLGVGAGAFVFPDGKGYPSFAEAFVDYTAYILDKKSTPVAGLKAGYTRALNFGSKVNGFENKYSFEQGASLQPMIGWNWGFNNGCGFTVAAGANVVLPLGQNKGTKPLYALPKISFTFEF